MTRSWQGTSNGAPRPPVPLRVRIVRGVVLLGVIALTAACAASGSGNGSARRPAAPKLEAWQATEQQYDAMGTVAYARDLVVTADTGVYAYDRATGKALWQVKPPTISSDQGTFCGSGQSAPDGLLPVGLGALTNPGSHEVECDAVGLVNLKTGKLAWVQPVPTRAAAQGTVVPPMGIVTEISGSTVVASWGDIASGFSATGKRLWTQRYIGSNIDDLAVAHGQFYAVFDVPAPRPGQAPMAIDGISAASGNVTSRLHVTSRTTGTGEPDMGAFVSTDPVTVLVTDDSDAARASYLVLDPAGQHVVRVIPAGAQTPDEPGRILDAGYAGGDSHSHPYVRTIVAAGKLISVTSPRQGVPQRLAAYDLSTGARSWAVVPPGLTIVGPVAVEGSTVVATALGVASMQPALVRVSLSSGKVLSATQRPADRYGLAGLFLDFHFTWADGRVYAVDWNRTPTVAGTPSLFTMPASG